MLQRAVAASIYHPHHWRGAGSGWLLPASILPHQASGLRGKGWWVQKFRGGLAETSREMEGPPSLQGAPKLEPRVCVLVGGALCEPRAASIFLPQNVQGCVRMELVKTLGRAWAIP